MNEKQPKISVIVPVYKAEAYLHRCVDSILAQTFQDFEILLVDDGSPDRSGEICDEYVKKDKRVRAFHKENGGAGDARKYGVINAIGEWIMFVDSDDTIPSDAMEQLHNLHNKCDADIICGIVNFSSGYVNRSQRVGSMSNIEYINALLLNETNIGPYAKLIKRSLFNMDDWNVDRDIKQHEDLLMLVNLSLDANSVYIDQNVICYNYLQRSGSASSQVQPIQVWMKMFTLLRGKIKTVYNVIPDSFYSYMLHRLYYNVLQRVAFKEFQNLGIESILQECSTVKLRIKDRYILHVLRSKYLQYIDYYLHKIKYFLRRI